MKIINQNHTMNIPFDRIGVYRYGNVIYCHDTCNLSTGLVTDGNTLGIYSTPEKAELVFNMINGCYLKTFIAKGKEKALCGAFIMPSDSELEGVE